MKTFNQFVLLKEDVFDDRQNSMLHHAKSLGFKHEKTIPCTNNTAEQHHLIHPQNKSKLIIHNEPVAGAASTNYGARRKRNFDHQWQHKTEQGRNTFGVSATDLTPHLKSLK